MNKDCVHTIYFDPQKYSVCNKLNGEGYSLLYRDLATSAINHDYQIVKNGFYIVGVLTANRFSCSRCIQYKGDIKCRQLTLFRSKTFHNDAINSRDLIEKKMSRRSATQRPIDNECKCSFFFSVQCDEFGFFLAPRVGNKHHSFHPKLNDEQIVFPPRLLNKETKSIIEKISKANCNHTIAANVVFHTTGIILSKYNVAYLSSLCSKLQHLDDMKKQNPTEK